MILENSDISDDDVHEDKVVTEEPAQEETAAVVDDYNYDDEEILIYPLFFILNKKTFRNWNIHHFLFRDLKG